MKAEENYLLVASLWADWITFQLSQRANVVLYFLLFFHGKNIWRRLFRSWFFAALERRKEIKSLFWLWSREEEEKHFLIIKKSHFYGNFLLIAKSEKIFLSLEAVFPVLCFFMCINFQMKTLTTWLADISCKLKGAFNGFPMNTITDGLVTFDVED